jgi:hypothetical protein
MKPLRLTVFTSLVGGAFLTFAAPSHAAFNGRSFNRSALANDIRSDRNEIQQEREKLGPAESESGSREITRRPARRRESPRDRQ